MLGHFLSKLNPALLFGLTNQKVKFPDIFIKKLGFTVPVKNQFSKDLDDGKNGQNEIRIRSGGDERTCTSTNCIFEFCINKDIPISLAIDHLKNGSFYEFTIQLYCK